MSEENKKNTGDVESQIEFLNKRISTLTEHLKKNHKDFSSYRGLMKLVGKRKSLVNYLNKNKK